MAYLAHSPKIKLLDLVIYLSSLVIDDLLQPCRAADTEADLHATGATAVATR